MQPLILNWHGPVDLQVFEKAQASSVPLNVPPANSRVVYLWCIRIVRHGEDCWVVYYVGSTQQFQERRMREHCNKFIGGKYSLFDPDDVVRGEINILYIPGYDERHSRLEKLARDNLSHIKVFWAEVAGDWDEKDVEGALRIKILRKQETRAYHYGQEQASLKLHHEFVNNHFPDGCKVIGLQTCASLPGQL